MQPQFHPPIPTARRIVPWRTLGMLAGGVLLAHALVLQTQPARFGLAPEPALQRAPAFITRSIAPPPAQISPPPALPAPPATAKPPPAAKPAQKPVIKQKVPAAQIKPTPPAIDSIAQSVLIDPPPMPPEPDSTAPAPGAPQPAAQTQGAGPDTAPASAASSAQAAAPPTSPPPPSQTPVTAMDLPASVLLDYQMTGSAKGLTYHAQGELAWENTGAGYNARVTAKAFLIGARTLSSTGQISAQGLAPSRFSDRSRSELAAHFEPTKGQISFSANTPPVPWVEGAQDRVSVILQLGGMLAGNPAGFPVGSTITVLTAGPRDADYWTFLVEREEVLGLPFGALATVKLSRQPRREYDQKVELWYAPSLVYLPVRNKITQANGDFVDQQLKQVSRP
ncbi:MAG: hypothetical protein JWR60_3473 [Polaromonas sp.]|nr:hypothetical protein [Polaromonas sp.]